MVVRVRRARVVEPVRVRRVRSMPAARGKPTYVVDWSMPLAKKFQLYLLTSHLYYQLHFSVIKDHEYDRLCNELYDGWRSFRHQHKNCVDRGQLLAGTGYAIEYPRIVTLASEYFIREYAEV